MLILQSSLANDAEVCVLCRGGAWNKRVVFTFYFADSWKWVSGSSAPLPPCGFLRHHQRSVLPSHHGDRKQEPSAPGQVGRPSQCPCFRLGLCCLNFTASPSGVCSAYSVHSGIQNVREGRTLVMSLSLTPRCVCTRELVTREEQG